MAVMSYEEWYSKAKPAADAKGHPTDDKTMRRAYDSYVFHAENPQGKNLGKGGTGTEEQQRTGAMKGGSFADDSPDAGNFNTGDPYLDELRSGKVAGEEDWRRFSNAQLKEMEQFYVGGGKFKNAYGDIVSKPQDRGPNTPAGVNGLGQPMGQGGGGGGQGGGGGAGGGGGRGGGGRAYGALNPDLQKRLVSMFSDKGGGFFNEHPEQGMSLASGGMVFRDVPEPKPLQGPNLDAMKQRAGTQIQTPGGGPAGGFVGPGQAPPSPAVTNATLNAFTPGAPSQTGVGAAPAGPVPPTAPTGAIGAPEQPGTPQSTRPVLPGAGGGFMGRPDTGPSPLQQRLKAKFATPAQWWQQ